jgi:endogenous inhibitor of DNA gyrase (YacG/DUF329 family)
MPTVVRCPICGAQVRFNDPNMPFCSDRCRLLDLGNWASEKYVIGSERIDELEESGTLREPEDNIE